MSSVPLESEVLIIGSGAVGSALAAQLATAGHQIVILEAGPARSQADLISSPIWARRLKWGGTPVVESGDKPVGHGFNAGYGTGGSALHHYAVWPRLHPNDFSVWSDHGRGLDWPLTYEELRQHYDGVQSEVGISGDALQETWRPPGAPYPLPPSPVFAQGAVIRRGFDKLGRRTAPLPLAVTTTEFNGRPACLWDGWCDAGCPIGALANPLTVHLPKALAAGATLVTEATAARILTQPSGERANAVEYVTPDGLRHRIDAKLIVLAAFSIENPRLLLASSNERHPHGLGNSSGMLGRYITSHTAGLVYGLFADLTMPHLGAFGGQLLNQDRYDKTQHEDPQAFGSYQWMIAQAVKPVDLLGISTTRPDLIGAELHRFMRRAAAHFATMTAVVEDLPLADNRVRLLDRIDRHGVPLAEVVHNQHAASKALWQSALRDGVEVFRAAGAEQVWTGPGGAVHIMGGTVMGHDAGTSVTDSHGRLHDLANVFVAGPGLFPTSGGVNPTFTALALARRTGEYLVSNFNALLA